MAKMRHLDWYLYSYILVLLMMGLMFCYSASSVFGMLRGWGEWYFISRQLLATAIGLAFMIPLARMDFRKWNSPMLAFLAMGSTTAMVLLAAILDTRAHRWLKLPVLQVQPSEFAKPALILFCAFFIAKRLNAINDRHTIFPASIVVGLLGALVAWGDLGTAVVLMMTAALLFFVAGLRWRYIALALVISMAGACVSIATKPYRLVRVIAYVDPDLEYLSKAAPDFAEGFRKSLQEQRRDPQYQVTQSVVAVGSGGVTGLGLMEGKQKLLFLPEAHTDFIFAVVAEETGLIGSLAILALYLLIAWRGLRIYFHSTNHFARYLALGITILLVFQSLMNISVALAIGPTKGIPLPLISYGGSAMIGALICFGMLLSVSEESH